MTKFTQGEWKIKIIDSESPGYHRHNVYALIEPKVGYVGWDSMGVYKDPLDGGKKKEIKTLNAEALANARLIATAPAMYQVLQSAINGIETLQMSSGSTNEAGFETLRQIRAVLAAIDGEG